MDNFSLHDLEAVIATRAKADPAESHTAKLVARGMSQATKKLGEEAVEAVIAAMKGDRIELVKESADVVYHLLVVLHMAGISLDEITAELHHRTMQSGLAEKASRKVP
jgi:phosphoribosyl-ATP pyrophosphohydrolase